MFTRNLLRTLGVVAIVLTVFPYIPLDHWSIRIFDFPHVQLTIFTFACLLLSGLLLRRKQWSDVIFTILLSACFLFQAWKIYPYTKLAAFEVLPPNDENASTLKVYSANLLQDNDEWLALRQNIQALNPDLLVFTEVDSIWRNRIQSYMSEKFEFKVEKILDNTYGMALYSRHPLSDYSVKYMVEDTIPSIHTKLHLPDGNTIQIFAIHPAPPTPHHNPSSVDRDSEMMLIANLVRDSHYPVIVLGDFNDVAWSETTSLFQAVSKLLDLRKGRGLFNTYNAKSWFLRWPLDHVFTSAEFRVREVKLGEFFESDHFPFYCYLTFEPSKSRVQELEAPSPKDLQDAKMQIEKEKKDDKKDAVEENN